jgi:hypothetical protein
MYNNAILPHVNNITKLKLFMTRGKNKFTTTAFFYLLLMGLFLTSNISFSQQKRNINVLKANKIGKSFYFNLSNEQNGFREIIISYLGHIKTNNHGTFKVLIWEGVWGPNHHTSGIIYIYDWGNKYVGEYNLGSGLDLPEKIENGRLIFNNKLKEECNSKVVSRIDFRNGPPSEIFIECKDKHGDIYSFSK